MRLSQLATTYTKLLFAMCGGTAQTLEISFISLSAGLTQKPLTETLG